MIQMQSSKSISSGAQYVICTAKLDEENPKYVGLAQERVLAPHS